MSPSETDPEEASCCLEDIGAGQDMRICRRWINGKKQKDKSVRSNYRRRKVTFNRKYQGNEEDERLKAGCSRRGNGLKLPV